MIDDVRDPTPDDEWLGQAVAIGAARLRILEPTERCVMVTSAQAELEQAPDVLRTITQEAGLLFELYAEVVVPGEIKRGDLAALCDDWRGFSSILYMLLVSSAGRPVSSRAERCPRNRPNPARSRKN